MKGARSQNTKQNKQFASHIPKPEIRDNLDSRENLEWDTKGDDVTHTKKETKEKHLKKKKK
jgi:hypothetical protein